eukprot:gene7129-biopygen4644
MADPSARLAVHNWSILDSVDGLVETHGPKVESLELPLFPTNADMAALNARILLLTSEASRKEESFGGGMPLHRPLQDMFCPDSAALYQEVVRTGSRSSTRRHRRQHGR